MSIFIMKPIRKVLRKMSLHKSPVSRVNNPIFMTRVNLINSFVSKFPSAKLDVVEKGSNFVLGVGKERLVLSLGRFYGPKEDRELHLAAKLYVWPEGFIKAVKARIARKIRIDQMPPEFLSDPHYLDNNHFVNHNAVSLLMREKQTLDHIGGLGIPVVWSKMMTFLLDKKETGFLLVEDLSSGGKFSFFEYANLNSENVINSELLKKQFLEYKERLMSAGVKVTEEGKHTLSNIVDLDLELSKTFFVVVNPKTKEGKLVVSDVDQISF